MHSKDLSGWIGTFLMENMLKEPVGILGSARACSIVGLTGTADTTLKPLSLIPKSDGQNSYG